MLESLGTLGILVIAVLRSLTRFNPQLLFDVDPVFDSTTLDGLGPAGSLWLDVILLLAVASVFLASFLNRTTVNRMWLLLALAPLPIVLYHGHSDAGDLWRGLTWSSSAIACVAIAHVARDQRWRAFILAVLLAALVPMLARGALQLSIEHESLVQEFEQQGHRYFDERGWAPDSPQASILERRLRQPQPHAWFVTSNVLATFMATGVIACTGLCISAVRRKLPSGYAGLSGLFGLACAAELLLTGSKGAMLAATAGLVLLIPPLVFPAARRLIDHRGGQMLVALVGMAILGVIVRGLLLPESFIGDKSLLFRWHYMQAASEIIVDHPLAGVGPDHFQDAYTLHRPLRNPEEVQSAHSVFLDWCATLGVSGLAWVLLSLLLLRHSKPDAVDASETAVVAPTTWMDARSHCWLVMTMLGVLAIGPAIMVEHHTLDPTASVVRFVGLACFVVMASLLLTSASHLDDRPLRWTLAVAAGTWCVHCQIEMSMTQPGAVLWGMCLLGLAGSGGGKQRPVVPDARSVTEVSSMLVCLVCTAAAVMVAWRHAVPAMRQQWQVSDAASRLAALQETPDDPDAVARLRRRAAADLQVAYHLWPINHLPLHAAVDQLLRVSHGVESTDVYSVAHEAASLAEIAATRHDRASSWQLLSRSCEQMAEVAADPVERSSRLSQAVSAASELTRRDPNGVQAWIRLGDLLWKSSRLGDARSAYQRAILNNANFELDPLKQMQPREHRRIEDRLAEIANSL